MRTSQCVLLARDVSGAGSTAARRASRARSRGAVAGAVALLQVDLVSRRAGEPSPRSRGSPPCGFKAFAAQVRPDASATVAVPTLLADREVPRADHRRL